MTQCAALLASAKLHTDEADDHRQPLMVANRLARHHHPRQRHEVECIDEQKQQQHRQPCQREQQLPAPWQQTAELSPDGGIDEQGQQSEQPLEEEHLGTASRAKRLLHQRVIRREEQTCRQHYDYAGHRAIAAAVGMPGRSLRSLRSKRRFVLDPIGSVSSCGRPERMAAEKVIPWPRRCGLIFRLCQ